MNKPRKTNIVKFVRDGLTNLVANLGTDRDKASHSYYGSLTLSDIDLANAYRFAWLPRKIVDVVANDACRQWRTWQTEGDGVKKLEKREDELNVQQKVLAALKKARLFGGCAVYIGTNAADPSKPLTMKEKIKHLTVIERRLLTAGQLDEDPTSETFGLPEYYTISNTSVVVHRSRLIIFVGNELPDSDLSLVGADKGWGDSVLFPIYEAIKNADATVANVASLVFEAKIDVISIPDFMSNLDDPEYEKLVMDRVYLAAKAKGINGALLLDADEEYHQKSANFSSLKDIIMAMMQVASGASDIPMTRLLGQSPGGLQSSGESDTRNYYDNVGAVQELQIKPAMELFDQLLVADTLGEGAEASYEWDSLWQSTENELADIGTKVSNTIKTLSDSGIFDDDELAKAAVTLLTETGIMPTLELGELPSEQEPDPMMPPAVPGQDPMAEQVAALDGVIRPLYVSRKVTNVADIRRWAEQQGIKDLPDDLHVTIMYSTTPVDWMKCGRAWGQEEDGSMRIAPGGPRDIDVYDGGAIVIEFVEPDLTWRHERILEAGAESSYSQYKPHITVSFDASLNVADIEPYQGPIMLGPEIFEDLKP